MRSTTESDKYLSTLESTEIEKIYILLHLPFILNLCHTQESVCSSKCVDTFAILSAMISYNCGYIIVVFRYLRE